MKRLLIGLLFLSSTASADLQIEGDPLSEFWGNLLDLCGEAFEGRLVQHPEGETDWVGKRLVMHVRDCHRDWIRIPFFVGEDRSRTWLLTRRDGRLQLKHVHRHPDGSPEEVSMYGGTTTNRGRGTAQYFPADEATRQMIEAAFSNVWFLGIEPDLRFTYGLRRLGTERVFEVAFDLSSPIEAPPPPWGWID